MALQKRLEFEIGLIAPEAYIRIYEARYRADGAVYDVHIHADKAARTANPHIYERDEVHNAAIDLTAKTNPLIEGYKYLKTIAKYAGSTDV